VGRLGFFGFTLVLLAAGLGVAGPGAQPAWSAVPTTWCGTGITATDRLPDQSGRQFHAIYAVPSDGPERFVAAANEIATDLATVEAWWQREDPARTLRFDTYPFPGCSGLGQLDLSFVRLPQTLGFYQSFTGRFTKLASDLLQGFGSPGKKYLVYFEGQPDGDDACGQATTSLGDLGPSFAMIYLGVPGCGTLGQGSYTAITAAHELVHAMGAVATGAPHRCADSGHTCDNGADLMHPNGYADGPLESTLLDVGRDDYYGHSGGWIDVQDSLYLRRLDVPQQPLTVSLAGVAGTSTVKSDAPGIDCPTVCSIAWDGGTRVSLEAIPAEDLRVIGWSGACTGTSPTCEVTMDRPQTASVRFGPLSYAGRVLVAGRGRVTNAGLGFSCARNCSQRFEAGRTFAFRAAPARGWVFKSWQGDCRGKTACRLRFDKSHTIRAVFARR
jgi:Divergent InlB B-repeat domain